MNLVGLDLNATRVRAVTGTPGRPVALLKLDSDRIELPLAISLAEKQLQLGQAGFALTRSRPHLACLDFLPYMGLDRIWTGGSHRLDGSQATEFVLRSMVRLLGKNAGIGLVLPAYLEDQQVLLFYRLAEKVGLPVLGSMAAPMAAVLSSPVISAQDSSGLILVIDADGHAMTLSVVERNGGDLRLRLVQSSPHLQRGLWLRRLVDGAAARCVRQCRRDPRESAQTEQYLYEQFVHLLDQGSSRPVQMHLQGDGWFHHLFLQAEDMAGMVLPLLRVLQTDIQSVLGTLESMGSLSAVVATQSVVGLPGVIPLLRNRLNARPPTPAPTTLTDEDYGDLLLRISTQSVGVHPLPPDALSCLAHELAVRVHSGDFPRGHLNTVRLPQASAPGSLSDQGPARLFYRGQEHSLGGGTFSLGRDPSCDLVFESDLFPQVSGRHCDIQFDRRAYLILDRSRHGTLVNDRPIRQQASLNSGDWIRLGPRGPVLRFLGEVSLTR